MPLTPDEQARLTSLVAREYIERAQRRASDGSATWQ